MTNMIRTMILVGVSTLVLGAQTVNEKNLQQMAKAATTAVQHGEVAKQYTLRAEQFEAKAKKHEANAAELAARKNNYAMTHKWPAMIQGPIDREKGLAVEARRAAEESLTLAAKHGQAAVQLEARGNGAPRQGL
jgi:hypothetical protein